MVGSVPISFKKNDIFHKKNDIYFLELVKYMMEISEDIFGF